MSTDLFPLMLEDVSLEVDNVRLLDEISLRLEGEGKTIILGPNGAGKSLLLAVCHGLKQPTAGQVSWGGQPWPDFRDFGFVFQIPVMLRRSVLANITFPLSLRGVARAEQQARTLATLDWAGLGHLASRPARVLSGGERQRVALARAAASKPKVLFLDEPTASLDPHAIMEVERMIDDLSAQGSKIIMTTHDLAGAKRLADDIVFMHQGRVLEHTPAQAFFRAPTFKQAQLFLAGGLLV